MIKKFADYFAADGALAHTLPNYLPRPQQIRAAEAVEQALSGPARVSLIEAGTGVGKTMAYLIPALLHARQDRKVVISTHTLALQSQLWERDIPTAQKLGKRPVKAALLKGRGNYLCLNELAAARGELWTAGDPGFAKIAEWSRETESGDMAELPFAYTNWADIRANVDTCKGQECRWYEECFYYRARRLAEEASLVLVNHALFFADLAVRQTEPEARLLPDYDFVVFDEAHHLENAAAGAFGIAFSSGRLQALLARVRRGTRGLDIDESRLAVLEKEAESLFHPFVHAGRPEFVVEELLGDSLDTARGQVAMIGALLDSLVTEIKHADIGHNQTVKDRVEGLIRQCVRAKEELTVLFNGTDENYLRWGSASASRGRGMQATLCWTPISVAPILSEALWKGQDTGAALVSATLSTGGRFEFVKQRLGIAAPIDSDPAVAEGMLKAQAPEDGVCVAELAPLKVAPGVSELIVDSPFDYAANCLLYVARHLPSPTQSAGYGPRAIDEIIELVHASGGGAFLLFTSHRMLQEAHAALEAARIPFPLLRQGDMPGGRLISAFRQEKNAVLFGTQSFWEGVDVPGDTLRLVVIDRLPFAVPDSPLHKARVDAITRAGGDWFGQYALPAAQLRLKQGFGRLIRTSADRGVVAILDSRLATKSYGWQFLRHLPPAKRTFDLEAVRRFYAIGGDDAAGAQPRA